MNLFKITDSLKEFADTYFKPPKLKAVLRSISDHEKNAFIHQWMTEGIPYCFKECPFMFEFSRIWLGAKLQIHPKSITMIGSGRFGFSLSPSSYGKAFDERSDLDLTLISAVIFNRLSDDYHAWERDYKLGIIRPANGERERWESNLGEVKKNIARGFIDVNRIPTKYPMVIKTMSALDELNQILRMREILTVKRISARTFKDWDAATKHFRLNLDYTIESFE